MVALHSLTWLDLRRNPIQRDWERLPTGLRELDLAGCSLAEVPEELAGLGSLTSLDLTDNTITRGWARLRPLSRLEKLRLAYLEGLLTGLEQGAPVQAAAGSMA